MIKKSNVLFVGNGFDLLCGYKTRYKDLLLHYKDHYNDLLIIVMKLIIEKTGETGEQELSALEKNAGRIDQLVDEIFYSLNSNLHLDKDDVRKPPFSVFSITSGRLRIPYMLSKGLKSADMDEFLDISYIEKNFFGTKKFPNIWLIYFIVMSNKVNSIEENWADLENLVLRNVEKEKDPNLTLEIKVFAEFCEKFGFNADVFEEYQEFKKLLATYISKEKENGKGEISIKNRLAEQYNVVLCFNYKEPEFDIKSPIFIHGHVRQKENIVFGFDDSITTNNDNFELQLAAPEDIKLSKSHQLLKLSQNPLSKNLSAENILPKQEDISRVGILGHGISEADYNYFSTICDFDKVTIEIFWYQYRDENGKKIKENNRTQLTDSVFKMLKTMEEQQKKRILHRMLIEQRIIFTELEYTV